MWAVGGCGAGAGLVVPLLPAVPAGAARGRLCPGEPAAAARGPWKVLAEAPGVRAAEALSQARRPRGREGRARLRAPARRPRGSTFTGAAKNRRRASPK